MGGYRGEEEGISTPASSPFRRWIWAGCMVAYVVPLIFLWGVTDFPESFGVPKCNGRGCIFEDWYHSYLLIDRHSLFDVLTFFYMWAPVVALIAWFVIPKLSGTKFSLYDDAEPRAGVSRQAVGTSSIFDAEEAAEKRRKTLMFLASSVAFGALLITILYYKGAL